MSVDFDSFDHKWDMVADCAAVSKYKDIRKDVERLVAVAIEEHRQEEAAVAELVNETKAA
jgi:hypothetical protein